MQPLPSASPAASPPHAQPRRAPLPVRSTDVRLWWCLLPAANSGSLGTKMEAPREARHSNLCDSSCRMDVCQED
ncbi:unnamed protein product [Urochloa humidicola]